MNDTTMTRTTCFWDRRPKWGDSFGMQWTRGDAALVGCFRK